MPDNKVKEGFRAAHLALPRPFLDSWQRNMSHLLRSVQAAFPEVGGPEAVGGLGAADELR